MIRWRSPALCGVSLSGAVIFMHQSCTRLLLSENIDPKRHNTNNNGSSFGTDTERTNKQIRQANRCPELVTFAYFPLFVVGD
jgi:hypothetical protein